MSTTKIPAGAKKPTDRKTKGEDEAPDPTMSFTRDGKTYTSLPMSEATTAELILEQPDPEKCTDWEKMQFGLKLTLSAFREDPEAVEHVKKMSLSEINEMNDEVEDEAGVSPGE